MVYDRKRRREFSPVMAAGANGEWIIGAETLDAYQTDGSIPGYVCFHSARSDERESLLTVRAVAVEKKGKGDERTTRSEADIVHC